MKTKYLLTCVVALSVFSRAGYGQNLWKIDSTRVVFHISNAGFDVEGTIGGIAGDVKFSKNKLSQSSFSASAKSGTIQTGIHLRDKHLKKTDYFDAEKFPVITIESKRITKSKNGFESLSLLTLKGHTRDIIIRFTFIEDSKKGELKGTFSINRLDFGLGETSLVLSDTVVVDVWIGVVPAVN